MSIPGNRLRIGMLLNRYLPAVGGSEVQAAQLAGELTRRGHSVRIVTRRLSRDLPRHETIGGIDVTRLGPVGLGHAANAAMVPRMLGHLVATQGFYDVLHVHGAGPVGLATLLAGRLTGLPVVLKTTTRGGLAREDPEGIHTSAYSRFVRRVMLPPPLWRSLLSGAGAIVTISTEVARGARALGLETRVEQIPNGVDTARFRPADRAEKLRLRRELGLPPDRFLLLFAGRLVYLKRIDVLLRALPAVLAKHADCHVVLAGSGEMQEDSVAGELHALAGELGIAERVTFMGLVSDVERVYRAADAFAFPSVREGLPNAVLEAMASELPIAASRIGGVTDLLTPDCGWLVEPGSVEALAGALTEIVGDPDQAQRRGAAARERAERAFSLPAIADRYEDLYASLLAARG